MVAGLLVGFGLITCIPSTADAGRKKYYLTQDNFDGSHALTACDNGFHMASIWEILDPSNLKYDTELGRTTDDSGSGPPSGLEGWIHTGGADADSGGAGNANCRTWTSNSGSDAGTFVFLEHTWPGSSTAISPWQAIDANCDAVASGVWCVQK